MWVTIHTTLSDRKQNTTRAVSCAPPGPQRRTPDVTAWGAAARYPAGHDRPRKTPCPKDPAVEAEFLRKTVLGILSVLETKGLLSTQEVDGILRAARAAATPPHPRLGGPAATAQWTRPGQPHQPMDRSGPVVIPNVLRAAPATAAPSAAPAEATARQDTPTSPAPHRNCPSWTSTCSKRHARCEKARR